MNTEFSFNGKNVLILGLARQGLALARFFTGAGASVTISDAAPAAEMESELRALGALPVALALGGHPLELLDRCDLLCLSGGVPTHLEIVQAAIRRGIPLSNDSLLTLQMARHLGLGPLIAITGSSGKTTTTTLVGEILTASGERAHVGGNIGTPLLDRLDRIRPGDMIVLELSSFQLQLFDPALAWMPFKAVGPDIAAILNVTPNHLDRHESMAAYANAKLNLLRSLPANASVILSADDPVTACLIEPEPGRGQLAFPSAWKLDESLAELRATLQAAEHQVVAFGLDTETPGGANLSDQHLIYDEQTICRRDEVQLLGDHNISNLLAAAAISSAAGATIDAMRHVARTFHGVPHRLEIVASRNDILWINDSIATAPERALAGLRSFAPSERTMILLAGGKDKDLPWEVLADEVIERVDYLIGFGQAGSMFVNLVQQRAQYARVDAPNCAVVQRLEEAVELAARAARPGTVVLLSPGGTSFDAYRDFEARGEHFRQLVRSQHEPTTAGLATDLRPTNASIR